MKSVSKKNTLTVSLIPAFHYGILQDPLSLHNDQVIIPDINQSFNSWC